MLLLHVIQSAKGDLLVAQAPLCDIPMQVMKKMFRQQIEYLDEFGKRRRRFVQPDSIFSLRSNAGKPHRLRFFVELDNNTETHIDFAREKVYPGMQLLHSSTFRQTFNTEKPAPFLVISTCSEQQLKHFRAQVTVAGGARYFLFTQYDLMTSQNPLTTAIWQLSYTDKRFSLEQYDTDDFQAFIQKNTTHLKMPRLL